MLFRIYGFLEYVGDYLGFLQSVLLLFKHQAMVLIRITFKNERPGNIVQKLLDGVSEPKKGKQNLFVFMFPFSRKEVD